MFLIYLYQDIRKFYFLKHKKDPFLEVLAFFRGFFLHIFLNKNKLDTFINKNKGIYWWK